MVLILTDFMFFQWARQSYYEALFSLATSILDDAETYMALKSHLQRYRHNLESDPIPRPREEPKPEPVGGYIGGDNVQSEKLAEAIANALEKIEAADKLGNAILIPLVANENEVKGDPKKYNSAVDAYVEAFDASARVLEMDKLSFHSDWFSNFYRRNYDALVIKSMYDNVIDDVDKVRYW